MADVYSAASFLPTIKCSSCGRQVEISMMGEHICSPEPPSPQQPDLPLHEPEKGRLPPQVDTMAANRNYRAGQLTPVSISSGSQMSPRTPMGMRNGSSLGGSRAGDDFYAPKMASEHDYAPRMASEHDSPSSAAQLRRPHGYGGFGPSLSPGGNEDLDASPAPASSPNKSNTNLLMRMNSIAPGPFDIMNRRPDPPRRAFTSRDDNLLRRDGSTDGDDFQPSAMGRAGTFPRLNNPGESPARAPSAPGPGLASLGPRRRQPSNTSNDYSSNSSGSSSNIPQISLAASFGIGNPYHSPTESMSSTVSSLSRPSAPLSSAGSSFSSSSSFSSVSAAGPASSEQSRKPSGSAGGKADLDSLMDGLQSLKTEEQPKTDSYSNASNRNITNANYSPNITNANYGPNMTNNNSNNININNTHNSGYNDAGNNTAMYSTSAPRSPLTPTWPNTPPPRASPDQRPASRNDTTPAPLGTPSARPSRGNCKACGEPITGKSVSSADGRLTGRYHKACFVCTTCSAPFTSATFYVHNDQPYCEAHYHAVNGSLCGNCGLGIEGQYLADEADAKFHPTCFVCSDCTRPLRDGYFEVGGHVYCERDALRRLQPPPQNYYGYGPGPGPRGLPPGPGGGPRSGGPLPRMGSNLSAPPINGSGFGAPPMGRSPYGRPGPGAGGYGPGGNMRLGPPPPRLRMEKRMTRLGMI